MKSTDFTLKRYDADEGKVFDWAEPRYVKDKDGNQVRTYLCSKTLFLGVNDSIDNYIEVDAPVKED